MFKKRVKQCYWYVEIVIITLLLVWCSGKRSSFLEINVRFDSRLGIYFLHIFAIYFFKFLIQKIPLSEILGWKRINMCFLYIFSASNDVEIIQNFEYTLGDYSLLGLARGPRTFFQCPFFNIFSIFWWKSVY